MTYALIFFFVMAGFASYAYYVLRKTHKKNVLYTYSSFLFISFVAFVAIASMSHYINSKIHETLNFI